MVPFFEQLVAGEKIWLKIEKNFLFTEKVPEVAPKLYDAKIHLFYLEGREKSSVVGIFLGKD